MVRPLQLCIPFCGGKRLGGVTIGTGAMRLRNVKSDEFVHRHLAHCDFFERVLPLGHDVAVVRVAAPLTPTFVEALLPASVTETHAATAKLFNREGQWCYCQLIFRHASCRSLSLFVVRCFSFYPSCLPMWHTVCVVQYNVKKKGCATKMNKMSCTIERTAVPVL